MKIPNFIGQAYTSRSRAIDSQVCKNLYPEIERPESKNVKALIGRPGLSEYYDYGDDTVTGRGLYYSPVVSKLYCVAGSKVFYLNAGGTKTDLGTISSTDGTCRFAENASNEILLVSGQEGHIIDTLGDTLTKITVANYPNSGGFPSNPSHVGFIAGYFIVNDSTTGNFYWSDQDDGGTWDALNFSNAEGSPDGLEGLIVNRNELWLLGTTSYEVWYLTGEADDANRFRVISGTGRSKGTIAPDSISQIQDRVLWLGNGQEGFGCVWMSEGYEARKISTPAIEYAIRGYSRHNDAIGFTFQFENHAFYVLTFPTADQTWVYDVNTDMWHEWTYYDSSAASEERALCVYQAYFEGANYTQSRSSSKIYALDPDTYTDDGEGIQRIRSCPHLHADRKRVFYHGFELDLERGVGLATGQGSDPQVALEISNDGGFTFGSELWATMGKIGEYTARAQWHRLGQSRDRVFRVSVFDPVKTVFIAAHMDAKVGMS